MYAEYVWLFCVQLQIKGPPHGSDLVIYCSEKGSWDWTAGSGVQLCHQGPRLLPSFLCHLLHGGLCPHRSHLALAATPPDRTKGKGQKARPAESMRHHKSLLEPPPHDFCFILLAKMGHMTTSESSLRGEWEAGIKAGSVSWLYGSQLSSHAVHLGQ